MGYPNRPGHGAGGAYGRYPPSAASAYGSVYPPAHAYGGYPPAPAYGGYPPPPGPAYGSGYPPAPAYGGYPPPPGPAYGSGYPPASAYGGYPPPPAHAYGGYPPPPAHAYGGYPPAPAYGGYQNRPIIPGIVADGIQALAIGLDIYNLFGDGR